MYKEGTLVYDKSSSKEYKVCGSWFDPENKILFYIVMGTENSNHPCLKTGAQVTDKPPKVVTVRFSGYNFDGGYDYFINPESQVKAGDVLYSTEHNKSVTVIKVSNGRGRATKRFVGYKMGEMV